MPHQQKKKSKQSSSASKSDIPPMQFSPVEWRKAHEFQRNLDPSEAQRQGAMHYIRKNIFRALTPAEQKEHDRVKAANLAYEQKLAEAEQLRTARTISVDTKFGKFSLSVPGYKKMTFQEKINFRNAAVPAIEQAMNMHGRTSSKGSPPRLVLPSEHIPYAGDFATNLGTVQRIGDDATKFFKRNGGMPGPFGPLGRIDDQSGGIVTTGIRNIGKVGAKLEDGATFGMAHSIDDVDYGFLGNMIMPDKLVTSRLSPISNFSNSLADYIDPKTGMFETAVGGTNVAGTIVGLKIKGSKVKATRSESNIVNASKVTSNMKITNSKGVPIDTGTTVHQLAKKVATSAVKKRVNAEDEVTARKEGGKKFIGPISEKPSGNPHLFQEILDRQKGGFLPAQPKRALDLTNPFDFNIGFHLSRGKTDAKKKK